MRVEVIDGEVVILGPDGMAASLTPDSAEESGKRLLAAAHKARADHPPANDDDDGDRP